VNSDTFWSRFDLCYRFVLSERSAHLASCLSEARTQSVGKMTSKKHAVRWQDGFQEARSALARWLPRSTQCVDRTDRCHSSWIDCNVYNPYCGTTLLLALLNAFFYSIIHHDVGPIENRRGPITSLQLA